MNAPQTSSPAGASPAAESTPPQADDIVALEPATPAGGPLRSPDAMDERVAVRVEASDERPVAQTGPEAAVGEHAAPTEQQDPEQPRDAQDATVAIEQLSIDVASPSDTSQQQALEPGCIDVMSSPLPAAVQPQANDEAVDDIVDGVAREHDDARDAPLAVDESGTTRATDDDGRALIDVGNPRLFEDDDAAYSDVDGAEPVPAPVPKPLRSELCLQPSSGYFPANDLNRRSKGSLTVMCEIRRDGQRVFVPASINVVVGDAVLFRWFKRDDLVQVDDTGRPILDAKYNSRRDPDAPLPSEHYVHFTGPGRFRFESLEFPGQLRAQVSVSERRGTLRYYVLRVLAMAAIIFAFVSSITSAVVESSKSNYYVADPKAEDDAGLRLIEDVVKEKALPWIVAGVVFLVMVLLARLFFCCVPVRLNDFGRGFLEHQQRGSQLVATVVAFTILLAVTMSWVTYIKLSFGLSTLIGVVLDHVRSLLNEAVAVSVDVRFMLRSTPSSSTSSGLELLASVDETSDTIRQWADVGEELVRAALRLVTVFFFIGLHVYLLAACALLAGVRRRRASLMNAGFWFAIIGTAGVGVTIGVNAVVSDVLDRTRFAADGFGDSTLTTEQAQNLTGAGAESALVRFLVSCSANGSFSIAFVEERVASSVDRWNQGAPPELAFPDYDFTNASGIRNLNAYMDDVVRQVGIIEASLASNSSLLSRSIQSDFSADLLPTLQASVRVARTLLLLIDCGIIRRIFRDIVPVLDEYVIHVHRDLTSADLWLLNAILVAIVVAAVAAYVFDRPYKFWYEPQTGRWFRFRSSYLAHRRLLLKDFMEGSQSMMSASLAPHLSFHTTSLRRSFRVASSVDEAATVSINDPVSPRAVAEGAVDQELVASTVLPTDEPVAIDVANDAQGGQPLTSSQSNASPLADSNTGPAPLIVNGKMRTTVPWPELGESVVDRSPKWKAPSSCNRAGVFNFVYQAALLAGLMLLGEGGLLVALHRSYEHNRLAVRLLAAASCCTIFPLVSYAANEIDVVKVRVIGRVACFLLASAAFVLLVSNADDKFDHASECAQRNEEARNTGNSTALIVVTEGCGVDAMFQMTEQAVYSTVVAITCAIAVLASAVLVIFARRRVGDFLVVVVSEPENIISVVAMRHRYLKWRRAQRCQQHQLRYTNGKTNSPMLMSVGPTDAGAEGGNGGDAQEASDDDAEALRAAFDHDGAEGFSCAEDDEGFTAESSAFTL